MLYAPNLLNMFPQRIWNGAYSELLIALPLFMMAGELMNTGGITRRIINFCLQILRPIRGGLGEVNIVASMISAEFPVPLLQIPLLLAPS